MHLFRWHPPSPIFYAIKRGRKPLQLLIWRGLTLAVGIVLFTTLTLLTTLPVQAQDNEIAKVSESNEATAVNATFGFEYAVPNRPLNLVEEAPGRMWYTSSDAGGIGFLEVIPSPDPFNVRYRTDFYGFGTLSQPYDLVYDDGIVWFTLRGIRSLGKIDVETREITTYPLDSVGAAPTGIDVDPNGHLWIAQSNGRISRFDPEIEEFDEYVMPDSLRVAPRVEDLVFYDERNIWFTMPDGNYVVAYDSIRDRFFGIATGHLKPTGLTFDPTGRLWVTAYGDSRIGRYTPTTVSLWVWYDTVTPDSGPAGVLAFQDELGTLQVWATENKAGTIARMQVVNSFEVVNLEKLGPNQPPGNTWGIIRASDGNIWVADAGRNLLYEIVNPYINRVYVPSLFKDAPVTEAPVPEETDTEETDTEETASTN